MTQVQNLEKQLSDQKKLKDRAAAALRLGQNREFKRLILDEFCGTECARYAQESGDPALNAEQRADALAMAQASGHLRRYLSIVVRMGAMADRNIADIEEHLEEARAEEASAE